LPFRILIADDHSAVRSVLRALIESHADWQVCGEAVNGFEAVVKTEELKPDLLVLDMAMPIMDGIRSGARDFQGFLDATDFDAHDA